VEKNDPELKSFALKKITYGNIKKSNVIINYDNCRKYIAKKTT
jgi:hypothetical protein